jgi:PAS domain S-box-containing protein
MACVISPMIDQTAFPDERVDLYLGKSRTARIILDTEWATNPLGEPSTWPKSLVTTLRLVLNTTQPICLWWGPELINFHNDAYEPMLGIRKDRAIGRRAQDLWPDVWEDVLPLVNKALDGEATSLIELPLVVTRNGYEEPTNWTFSYSPVFDDDGNVAGMLNIVMEATEAVLTRRQLADAYQAAKQHIEVQQKLVDQREALQAELAHRMKNTVAMTQAVVSQSLRHAKSMEEAADTISGRLVALAQAQDLLVQDGGQRAGISDVVHRALEPHRDHGGRFQITGPDFVLESPQALGITLALHELATNSAKYGALSAESGMVEIGWTLDAGKMVFAWKELGGPPVVAPSSRGFGSRLKDKIVPTYFRGKGRTLFEPDGVRYVLKGEIAAGPTQPGEQP